MISANFPMKIVHFIFKRFLTIKCVYQTSSSASPRGEYCNFLGWVYMTYNMSKSVCIDRCSGIIQGLFTFASIHIFNKSLI